MKPVPAPYRFVATEYVSDDGDGPVRITRTRQGTWRVAMWFRPTGYEVICDGCPTVEDAFAAFAEWIKRAPDNDVAF